jgi:protocatechuate 3,4-dioxygenase beta subunit
VSKLTLAKAVVLFVIGLTAYGLPSSKGSCNCSPASGSDQTSWGHRNVIIKKDQAVKSLRGKVIVAANGQPLEGVLVEVYDKPDGLLLDWKERESRKAQQKRIAACITGADGQFCFANIPPGKYELRSSKPVEWDPTSIYIVVAPRNRRSVRSPLTVELHASQ